MAEIVLQANSKMLTPADIIGSTFRDARLSWRTTVTIFLLPSFASSFSYFVENWPTQHQAAIGTELSFVTVAFCILMNRALRHSLKAIRNSSLSIKAIKRCSLSNKTGRPKERTCIFIVLARTGSRWHFNDFYALVDPRAQRLSECRR